MGEAYQPVDHTGSGNGANTNFREKYLAIDILSFSHFLSIDCQILFPDVGIGAISASGVVNRLVCLTHLPLYVPSNT